MRAGSSPGWLTIALLFWREENWRRILVFTYCSKDDVIGELDPALAVHCPVVLRRIGEGFWSVPAVLERKGLESWLFIALLFLRRIGEGFRSIPAVLERKGLESWLQPWLFIVLLFLRRIREGFRSVPAVLKRKGLESWLQPWLFIALLFLRRVGEGFRSRPAVLKRKDWRAGSSPGCSFPCCYWGELEKDFDLYLLF